MTPQDLIQDHLERGIRLRQQVGKHCGQAILDAATLLAARFEAGGQLLICGNGGSAADSQHMAAELMGRLRHDVEREGIPALALTTDTSFLTAHSNDVSFDDVFARQVRALGRSGDVLLAISTSGGSKNVLAAVASATERGLATIGLGGQSGVLASMVDVAIRVPSKDTGLIQEMHLSIEHMLCELVELHQVGRLSLV